MQMGQISFEEYVEALDEDSVAPKSKLEDILKERRAVRRPAGLSWSGAGNRVGPQGAPHEILGEAE